VRKAPGQALSDFNIFRLIAHHWGCGDLFKEWSSPEAAFRIMIRLSRGMPCDITGIEGYAHLEKEGGIQWPLPASPEWESKSEGVPRSEATTRPGAERTGTSEGLP